jgi:hypothetical protein
LGCLKSVWRRVRSSICGHEGPGGAASSTLKALSSRSSSSPYFRADDPRPIGLQGVDIWCIVRPARIFRPARPWPPPFQHFDWPKPDTSGALRTTAGYICRILLCPLLQLHRSTMRFTRQSASKSVRGDLPPPPSALRALFPDVEELTIELEFAHEFGWSPSNQLRILRPAALASFRYPCPFSGCSGWINLDEPTQALVQSHGESLVSELYCTGVRPRDRTIPKPCNVHVRYRIVATYGNSNA